MRSEELLTRASSQQWIGFGAARMGMSGITSLQVGTSQTAIKLVVRYRFLHERTDATVKLWNAGINFANSP